MIPGRPVNTNHQVTSTNHQVITKEIKVTANTNSTYIYISYDMKFGTQSRSSLLVINMIFEIADLGLQLNTRAGLVSKLHCA